MSATREQARTNDALAGIGAVLDHVAHAVPSVAEVLPLYRDILGGTAYAAGIHPVAHHAAVHVVFPDGGKVELLEPTSPASASVGSYLAGHPRGGLHHITFRVPDLAAALDVLSAQGFTPFGTNLVYPDWKETFLHPGQTGGVLIQLAQTARNYPPPMTMSVEEMLVEAAEVRERLGTELAAELAAGDTSEPSS